MGFLRLYLSDAAFNGVGTTVYINLRSDSITGTILGSTPPVSLGDRFNGTVNFFFTNPVAVTPGTTYYFQPVVQSGESFGAYAYNTFNYPGGTEFAHGVAVPSSDLWFREGTATPEPSGATLCLLGAAILLYFQRSRLQRHGSNPKSQ
jgi:hypothetical protein